VAIVSVLKIPFFVCYKVLAGNGPYLSTSPTLILFFSYLPDLSNLTIPPSGGPVFVMEQVYGSKGEAALGLLANRPQLWIGDGVPFLNVILT
jgi:hypothetical protein